MNDGENVITMFGSGTASKEAGGERTFEDVDQGDLLIEYLESVVEQLKALPIKEKPTRMVLMLQDDSLDSDGESEISLHSGGMSRVQDVVGLIEIGKTRLLVSDAI